MSTPVLRNPWMEIVLSALGELGKPVGDGVIPREGGWAPQMYAPGSVFVPYLVVSQVTASHSWGTLWEPQSDWQLPYAVESFGVTREQCDWMADKARGVLNALIHTHQQIGELSYGVMWVRFDSIGTPIRVDETQPPIWHSQDGITVWITKES